MGPGFRGTPLGRRLRGWNLSTALPGLWQVVWVGKTIPGGTGQELLLRRLCG